MTVRSRLAPTPSGYLHVGNAVNFLRTWLMVRAAGGTLRLRIDDADSERARPEFVEDIFTQLDWLGITWDEGPSGPDDLASRHSQLLRLDRYRQVLTELARKAHLFACSCSRKAIQEQSTSGLYPGTCRKRHGVGVGQAVRVHVPLHSVISVDGEAIPLCRSMGDFVLWRRTGLPAYQLASLTDDIDHGTTLIVRGRDLLESTAAQLFLARHLEENPFPQTNFVHHPLVTGETGQKLSKSHRSLSLHTMRASGTTPTAVYRLAAGQLGIPPAEIIDLDDLLDAFRQIHPKTPAVSAPSTKTPTTWPLDKKP